jgi:subtilisin family serine protease
MQNMKSVGILPAAAAGGGGPGAGTVGVPANYPTMIACGATDASDNIASFSPRGPAPDQNPWNDSTFWYYPSWELLKPDVSAPGVSIRTSYNDGGYVSMSGSSFAIPHASGGVALFCDKDSMLTVADLYSLFRAYCDEPSQGAPYPNMNYGWGRINLWRGLQAVTGVDEGETGRSMEPRPFLEAYPSVTRGRLTIAYDLGNRPQAAGISIYDIAGRMVKSFTIDPKPLAPCVIWNGDDRAGRPVTTGVYFIKLTTGDEEITKKISVLR